MNQMPTKQPQRQGRPNTAQKYQGRPIQLPERCAYPKGLVIVTVVTALLLVLSVVMLSVSLTVTLLLGDTSNDSDGGGGGKKDKTSTQTQTQSGLPSSTIRAKYLAFPSATAGASYLSAIPQGVASTDDSLKSESAILVDVSTGKAIFARDADVVIHPASMTKVMTLLVACEKATDPTELLTVTPEMIAALNVQQTKTVQSNGYWTSKGASTLGGWQAGDQITVEDALFLVNYQSDTIACWLLANRFGGGEQGFVNQMNQRAHALQLNKTSFKNCTGLEQEGHQTTCQEMAAIMQAAMNNPAAKKVLTSYESYDVSVYRDGKLSRTSEMYATWYSKRLENYPTVCKGSALKIIAGKTGWETTPTACFVTAAENTQTGQMYICVTVGRKTTEGAKVSEKWCAADARYLYRTYVEGKQVSWDALV